MMQHRFHMIAWLFAIWMLCSIPSVHAASLASQPSAWRTTPTLSADVYPSCQFRSTSTCAMVVGATSYTSNQVYSPGAKPSNIRRGTGSGWSDPDDDDDENTGVGVKPTVPVGEPFILLLLAFLWIVYKKKRATT